MDVEKRTEAELLIERADLLMVDSDSEEAAALLEQAVSIDPENSEAHRLLDGLHARLAAKGRYYSPPAAVAAPDPSLKEAESWTGSTAASANDTSVDQQVRQLLDEAREAARLGFDDREAVLLQRAVALDPGNADAQYLLRAIRDRMEVLPSPEPVIIRPEVPEPRTLRTRNVVVGRNRGAQGFARFIIAAVITYILVHAPGRHSHKSLHDIEHLSVVGDIAISVFGGMLAYMIDAMTSIAKARNPRLVR